MWDNMSMPKKRSSPRADPQFVKGFKARTKVLREGAGLSQGEVARALGIPVDTYKKYEGRERSMLPIYHVAAFLDAVNASHEDWRYLLSGARVKHVPPRTEPKKVRA